MNSPDGFDFWLGDWDLGWRDGVGIMAGRGRNTITRELGGAVIVERFDARPSEDFRGMSVSVFDPKAEVWRQTWVDSAGSYLDFVGGQVEDGMELAREVAGPDGPTRSRMRWREITEQSLLWTWERAAPGKDWRTLWVISYRRRPAA